MGERSCLTEEHDVRINLRSAHRVSNSRHPVGRVRSRQNMAAVPEATLAPMKRSLAELQGELGRRDFETWKLTREVRQCQKQIWQYTQEERLAWKHLRDHLSDTDSSSQLTELQRTEGKLSHAYADAKNAEMQASLVARRQRAFFAQSSFQEGMHLLKRHPAGEVFLAEEQPQAQQQQRLQSGRSTSIACAVNTTQYCNWEADEVIEDDEDDEDDDEDSFWETRSSRTSGQSGRTAPQHQVHPHDEDDEPVPPPPQGACGGARPATPDVEPLQLCPVSQGICLDPGDDPLQLCPLNSARSI